VQKKVTEKLAKLAEKTKERRAKEEVGLGARG